MFFLKKKTDTPTLVGQDVRSELVRQAQFPDIRPAPVEPVGTCIAQAVIGVPPEASFRDSPVSGVDQIAFITEGAASVPALALLNISNRVEVWELGPSRTFAQKRRVQFDAKQGDWVVYHISEIARLPNDRLLLSIGHGDGASLYVYDIASNQSTKLAKVTPLGVVPEQLLESAASFIKAQLQRVDVLFVDARQALVLFYTGEVRLAAEIYYMTPAHIMLFNAKYPQGTEVLQLGADDGVIQRWTVLQNTLFLATQDYRDRKNAKSYTMSLDLRNVLQN